MVTFDEVLPTLLRICEQHAGFDAVEKAVAVRDLRGRVRLAIKADSNQLDQASEDALKAKLERELGSWFVAPILGPSAPHPLKRLQATVLDKKQPWIDASWEDPVTGTTQRPPDGRWSLIERRLSPGSVRASTAELS
jgi:hypothetical protein